MILDYDDGVPAIYALLFYFLVIMFLLRYWYD